MKIIVFEQDNCGWCVRLHPHIKRLTEELGVDIEFVNITGRWEIADKYSLRTTPTVMVATPDDTPLKSFSINPETGIAGLIKETKEYIQYEYMW